MLQWQQNNITLYTVPYDQATMTIIALGILLHRVAFTIQLKRFATFMLKDAALFDNTTWRSTITTVNNISRFQIIYKKQ